MGIGLFAVYIYLLSCCTGHLDPVSCSSWKPGGGVVFKRYVCVAGGFVSGFGLSIFLVGGGYGVWRL